MLQKNIDKEERRNRSTWQGFFPRVTPTKTEKMRKSERKHRRKLEDE